MGCPRWGWISVWGGSAASVVRTEVCVEEGG